jgi:RimJ/RimL family protein N-acetyltransferase/ADP-ribose pyrophosphatase YjhB (NUDIX family)
MGTVTAKHCLRCGQALRHVEDEDRLRLRCPGCGWTYYGNPTPVVAALVERGTDAVLVRNVGWPEKWFGLVSGFLEANERPQDAVLREVREELGCPAELVAPIGTYAFPERNEVILAFHVRALGEPVPGPELAELKRVPLDKLRPWPFGTGHAVRDWLEARAAQRRGPLRLPDPPLRGDGFALRPFAPGDAEALVDACQDPAIQRWTRVPAPYGPEDAAAFLGSAAAGWESGERATFAIVSTEGGALLGAVGLLVRPPGLAELGYWLTASARGKGIATRAVRLAAAWAMEAAALERIELQIAPDNAASIRVAERSGFTREGLLRRYAYFHGELRDVLMFSRVRGDP